MPLILREPEGENNIVVHDLDLDNKVQIDVAPATVWLDIEQAKWLIIFLQDQVESFECKTR